MLLLVDTQTNRCAPCPCFWDVGKAEGPAFFPGVTTARPSLTPPWPFADRLCADRLIADRFIADRLCARPNSAECDSHSAVNPINFSPARGDIKLDNFINPVKTTTCRSPTPLGGSTPGTLITASSFRLPASGFRLPATSFRLRQCPVSVYHAARSCLKSFSASTFRYTMCPAG